MRGPEVGALLGAVVGVDERLAPSGDAPVGEVAQAEEEDAAVETAALEARVEVDRVVGRDMLGLPGVLRDPVGLKPLDLLERLLAPGLHRLDDHRVRHQLEADLVAPAEGIGQLAEGAVELGQRLVVVLENELIGLAVASDQRQRALEDDALVAIEALVEVVGA